MIFIPKTGDRATDVALEVIARKINDLEAAQSKVLQGTDTIENLPNGTIRVVRMGDGEYALQAKTPEGWITSTNVEFVLKDRYEVVRQVQFDTGTTKTTPGTVDKWEKIYIDGVEHYVPCYISKTS